MAANYCVSAPSVLREADSRTCAARETVPLTEQLYFCNTMPRANLAVRVAGAEIRRAGEMRRLLA